MGDTRKTKTKIKKNTQPTKKKKQTQSNKQKPNPFSILFTLELYTSVLTIYLFIFLDGLNKTVIWMDDADSVTLEWKFIQRGIWDWQNSEKPDYDIHLLYNEIVMWKKALQYLWYPDSSCCSQHVQLLYHRQAWILKAWRKKSLFRLFLRYNRVYISPAAIVSLSFQYSDTKSIITSHK